MVQEKVSTIEVPWTREGDVDFVATRIKWIETLGKDSKSSEKGKEEAHGGANDE